MSKYTITFQNNDGKMVKRDMTQIEETELEKSLAGSNEVPNIRTETDNGEGFNDLAP
jgi:hypothetical protein